ncbi:MAG: hypothetical protein BHW06_04900 [Clostridium sp. 44_14]|nr:MAG: hypothetical protein BHW06_04900 [Clostridium sp. 44_14]
MEKQYLVLQRCMEWWPVRALESIRELWKESGMVLWIQKAVRIQMVAQLVFLIQMDFEQGQLKRQELEKIFPE